MPSEVHTWQCPEGHEFNKHKSGAEEGAQAYLLCRECEERHVCTLIEVDSPEDFPFGDDAKEI